MVRAEAEDVAEVVWAVVWLPEGLDVRGFRVWAGGGHQLDSADLACVVMKTLGLSCDSGTSNEPLNCGLDPSGAGGRLRRSEAPG